MKCYLDPNFGFMELFNEKNGVLLRTDQIINGERETPFKRSYPELLDIGIMGRCVNQSTCKKVGIKCYQDYGNTSNMSFNDYRSIIDQIKGKTFQVALGGRGDPNKHERFKDILKYTRENDVIPNMTTSGFNITPTEIKLIQDCCGAVAISCYSKILERKETNLLFERVVNQFVDKIITNVHYVISESTIDDAIYRLQTDSFPNGINAVIFLLYKPVGAASQDWNNCIKRGNKMNQFFTVALNKQHNFKIGFDSCFTNYVIDWKSNDNNICCLQPCESGRFSAYISSDMKMYPCSFVQEEKFGCDLTQMTIQEAWFSKQFKEFVSLNKGSPYLCPIRMNNN